MGKEEYTIYYCQLWNEAANLIFLIAITQINNLILYYK